MTVDERLERRTERHEALIQPLSGEKKVRDKRMVEQDERLAEQHKRLPESMEGLARPLFVAQKDA